VIEWWPAIVFGWPAVIGAMALSVAGIVRKKPGFLLTAAVIVLPFALYLAATPRLRWVGLLLPVSLLVAAAALKKGRPTVAWALLVPAAALCSYVALIVLID
jgi:hypothetical protein